MTTLLTIIIIAVVLLAVSAALMAYDRRRLRASFGDELEPVVREYGSARQVDRELRRRKRRAAALGRNELGPEQRAEFAAAWEHLEAEFLDDPELALTGAEQLTRRVLKARGYPVDDPDEVLALLSADHAGVLPGYRAALQLGGQVQAQPRTTPTEELRQAMLAHLALCDELTQGRDTQPAPAREPAEAAPIPQTTPDKAVDR